ncbi:hypothetical protein, partial [Wolbachia endosymbiont of Cardiocondyla obscurior]|uniref:hypothetical protein n=1 Tax=Wolbachia endosymbiont of Cardiocondyla obscurior TaxID=2687307 RepID=UPI001FE407D8
ANESRYDGSRRHDDKVYTLSSQCLTLGSSFLYKFTKSVSFYNIKPILTKSNALLAIKFPGSQCLGTGITKEDVIPVPSTDHFWSLKLQLI